MHNVAEFLSTGIVKMPNGGYYFHPAEIQRALAGADGAAGVIATLLTRALDAEDRLRTEPQRPIVLDGGSGDS